MNLSECSTKQTTVAAVYNEAAEWIDSRRQDKDAQGLAKLMIFLSTKSWSYEVALNCTVQMNDPPLELALRVVHQYFHTGACEELARVARQLKSQFPSLPSNSTNCVAPSALSPDATMPRTISA